MIRSNYLTRIASMGFTRLLRRAGNRQAKSAAKPKIKILYQKKEDQADFC
jgi:hypothetical protein